MRKRFAHKPFYRFLSFATEPLSLESGTYTLTFAGTNALGDNTVFLDEVTLSFLSSDAITSYTYDGSGLRRSLQTVGTPPTTFIWDGVDYLGEY